MAPAVVILFTDEYWWAAINLHPALIWISALLAVLAGTALLLRSQRLLFPHRERNVITRHVALTNAAIIVNTLVLMVGLLFAVTVAVLAVEVLLFPSGFLDEWFNGRFDVGLDDHLPWPWSSAPPARSAAR